MSRPKLPLYKLQQARLERLRDVGYNYDIGKLAEYTTDTGWNLDSYEKQLGTEEAGSPQAGGLFERAKQMLHDYTFAPASLIQGIFDPSAPLKDRRMLLRGQFLGFSFWFGVHVYEVIDRVMTLPDGSQETLWGYSYRTLQGHFEQGQITFLVHKNLQSGRVSVTIQALSKTGHIANPFYRLGFKLFGRGLQRRFARLALKNLYQHATSGAKAVSGK